MRVALKRLLLSLLLLAGLYLLATNLFLATPLGPRLLRYLHPRTQRLRVEWGRAWSLIPGAVEVRDLRVRGDTGRVAWSIAVERGRGRIDLAALVERRFEVHGFRGSGVRAATRRHPEADAGPRAPGPPRPWRVRFTDVALERVREIAVDDFELAGDGHAAGGFRLAVGGDFRLDRSVLRLPGARLWFAGRPLARDLDLTAAATIAPYAPRRHPGVAGFAFVSGTLRATGKVPELPAAPVLGSGGPGTLALDLRLESGRLQPGSRLAIAAARRPAAAGPLLAFAAVEAAGGPLRLGVAVRGLALGAPGRPPVLESDRLALTAATAEVRLDRLLRRGWTAQQILPPLVGDVAVEGLRLDVDGSIAWHLAVDRGSGRLDVPALLRREVVLSGVRAQGAALRLDLRPARAGPPPRLWAVRLHDARIDGLREVALGGDRRLVGAARVAADLSFAPDGTLAVERAVFALSSGRLLAGRETVARDLTARGEARVAPFVPARAPGLAALRPLSGTCAATGRISSLGFLRRYLAATPGLALTGQGRLDADLRVARGRLLPGSRVAAGGPVRVAFLNSVATGRAAVTGAVVAAAGAPAAALAIDFRRFVVAPQEGGAPYLNGRGLRIALTSPDVDLATPVERLAAAVDLADGEVPDLAVYDPYLPRGAAVSILSGAGHLRLHLGIDAASRRGAATVVLTSEAARARFEELEIAGAVRLHAALASSDLRGGRFQLAGTRLELERVSYREEAAEKPTAGDWWARLEVANGTLAWGRPLALDGSLTARIKNSDLLLALFAQRDRRLGWFRGLLAVEGLAARGDLRLGNGALAVDDLRVVGPGVDLRSRLRFAADGRRGDLFLRYRRLAAGIELRDGRRTFRLHRPEEWYESRRGSP
jgi:hypothetical protein